jgi:hypothetical protein
MHNNLQNVNGVGYPYIQYVSPFIQMPMPMTVPMQIPIQQINPMQTMQTIQVPLQYQNQFINPNQYQSNYPNNMQTNNFQNNFPNQYNTPSYMNTTPNNNFTPYNNQNNYNSNPNQNLLTPFSTNSHPNPNYNSNQNSSSSEPNSCNYCEEIYKYTIMNNLPLKIMTCLYCNKNMNGTSLEFFLHKYKDELEAHYKNILLNSNTDSNIISNSGVESKNIEVTITNTNECEDSIINSTNQELDTVQTKSKDDYEISHMNELNIQMPYAKKEIYKNERLRSVDHVLHEKERDRDHKYKDESLNMVLDTTDTGMSLAEIFKQRRAKLLNKIDNRAHSVKDSYKNKSTTDLSESDNMEMKNINTKKDTTRKRKEKYAPRISLDLNSIAEEKKMKTYTENKSEPSAELLDRLINGTRAIVRIFLY